MREDLPEGLSDLETRLRNWQPAGAGSSVDDSQRLMFEAGRRQGKTESTAESKSLGWSSWVTVAALLLGLGLGSVGRFGESDQPTAGAPQSLVGDDVREFEPSTATFSGIADRSSYASLRLTLASNVEPEPSPQNAVDLEPSSGRDVLTPRSVFE